MNTDERANWALYGCIVIIMSYTPLFMVIDHRLTALEKRVTTLEKNFDGAVAAMVGHD